MLIRHLRTTASCLKRKIKTLTQSTRPAIQEPQRWNITNEQEAIKFLVHRAAELAQAANRLPILAIACEPDQSHPVVVRLRDLGFTVSLCPFTAVSALKSTQWSGVICLDFNSREVTIAAQTINASPQLKQVPFEYALVDAADYPLLIQHDVPYFSATHFRSPLLLDPVNPFSIYEESLKKFALKCEVRDFTELYQGLRHIVSQKVEGAVAEFGSFWGHSGYLIAQSLRGLGSEKQLYMFDTFDGFPEEPLGIDQFWNNTHPVCFTDVQAKFTGMESVSLIQGDFTQTLPQTSIDCFSLIFVDCDSYRGIRYLIEETYPRLSVGGLMIFEDYGHPALLGARLAVDEYFTDAEGCLRFFSQFSGFYIVMKLR